MMSPLRHPKLVAWMRSAGGGEIAPTPAVSSAWYDFNEQYDRASIAERKEADEIIEAMAQDPDPHARFEVLMHQDSRSRPDATRTLLKLLKEYPTLYDGQVVAGYTLRAHLLGTLGGRADPSRTSEIEAAIIANHDGAGVLTRSLGSFFGNQGFSAVDRLVRAIKPAKRIEEAIRGAGFSLSLTPEEWAKAERGIASWPAGLRTQLRDGAEAARRLR